MAVTDLIRFAWSALRGHRLRTALSTLGVAIGVASVLLLTGLGEGARTFVTAELATLGSNLIIVLPGKIETEGMVPFVGGVPQDLTLSDTENLLRRIPRIQSLAPLTLGQSSVSYGSLSRNIPVIGTTHEFAQIRRLMVSRGMFLPPGELDRGSPVCVIGSTVEKELFREENPLGKILRIGDWRFRIIGVLSSKGQSVGFNIDDLVLVPVATAMKMFDQTSVFRIFIEIHSYEELEQASAEIIRVLKERHDDEEDVTILTQDSVLASFNEIFTALTLALAGIAAISLSVAGVGIMNVMLVSVSERTSEIGLMKAVGVKPAQIVAVFLAEASLLCVIGGMIGLLFSKIMIALSNHVFPSFPVEIPLWAILSAVSVAVGVGLLFGVWPARRASRLDPILALGRR